MTSREKLVAGIAGAVGAVTIVVVLASVQGGPPPGAQSSPSATTSLVPSPTPSIPPASPRANATGAIAGSGPSAQSALRANGSSASPDISADGRYIAFSSLASNLVPGDANGASDIFVRDLVRGSTTLVSMSSSEVAGDKDSTEPSISADGTIVCFVSASTNFASGGGGSHIFVRDIRAGTTERVGSFRLGSVPGARRVALSGNGRFVAFTTPDSLVPEDVNGRIDVYVFDRTVRTFELVSVSIDSLGGTRDSWGPSISDDGTKVAFASPSPEFFPGARDGRFEHVFLRDRGKQTTTMVSPDGNEETYGSEASISSNGSVVAFTYGQQFIGGTRYISKIGIRNVATQELVTVPREGTHAAISADGRVVAYKAVQVTVEPGQSDPHLYPKDQLGIATFFVPTRHWAKVTDGVTPAISATGRYVAWVRSAVVYRRDRTSGATVTVVVPA